MTPLVLLLPLLAAMVGIAVNRHDDITKYIALAGSVLSLLVYPFVGTGTSSNTWFSIGGFNFNITTTLSQSASLQWLVVLAILAIGCLVFLYSSWFMELPSEQRRYYLEMLAFESAMLAFVMAGSFIVLFVAWEFLSLTSYLLIGFWHSRDRALAAARKAITIVLIGDVSLLAAIVMLQSTVGTLEFSSFVGPAAQYQLPLAVVTLLLIAIFTKSAQFPFQEWLPDAMEGPVPVSAYLHSSTMVKAGVFAAIVLAPVFAPQELSVMLWIGIVTAVLGMLNAMREQHIKRVLAYSTVQELGLMTAAIGGGAIAAAMYFFIIQGFYKALLFFSAGVSMKANDKERLSEMSGMRQNRIVYVTTLFGILGLAGFVPFAGFFASLQIGSSFATNVIAYAVISLIGMGTSFYAFRWIVLQSKKPASSSVAFGFDVIPAPVAFAMVALAVLTLPLLLPQGLGSQSLYEDMLETGLVAAGGFAAYRLYVRQAKRISKNAPSTVARNWDFVYSANLMNSIYIHLAGFVIVLADGFAYFDMKLDGLFDWFGRLMVRFGMGARRLATGGINAYAAVFAAGLLLLVLLVAVFGR